MPWQETPSLDKADLSSLRHLRRAKIYADEDIEDDVVIFLRESGVNIKSARELAGH
jgi:hypothetical protein